MSEATTTIFRRGGANNNEAWDDSELIALWNSQLDKIKQQADGGAQQIASADGSEDNTTTTEETSDSEECESDNSGVPRGQEVAFDFAELKECSAAAAGENRALNKKRGREEVDDDDDDDEVSLMMPPCPANMPPPVQRVLRAWFRFGFECGRYSLASSRPKEE